MPLVHSILWLTDSHATCLGPPTLLSVKARSGSLSDTLVAAAGSAAAQFLYSRLSARLARLPTELAMAALTMSRNRCSEKSPSCPRKLPYADRHGKDCNVPKSRRFVSPYVPNQRSPPHGEHMLSEVIIAS